MITIKDVAQKSGFSITTVSKALNNYSDISDSTKKVILDLCDEIGYVPNFYARSLVTRKSYAIGIIFEEIDGVGLDNPVLSKVLNSFRNVVEKAGYDILFLSNNIGEQKWSFLQHAQRKQVEAIFILNSDCDTNQIENLLDSKIPSVVIDYEYENVKTITSNTDLGLVKSVEYLHKLGHKKIAYIINEGDLNISNSIQMVFRSLMNKYELDISDDFFINESSSIAMNKILELDNQPTAIICSTDMIAIDIIQVIRNSGKSVPEDYSIIGLDGTDIGQILTPRLTTIKQDTLKMGELAANQIIELIKYKYMKITTETLVVDTYLIEGQTTKVL